MGPSHLYSDFFSQMGRLQIDAATRVNSWRGLETRSVRFLGKARNDDAMVNGQL